MRKFLFTIFTLVFLNCWAQDIEVKLFYQTGREIEESIAINTQTLMIKLSSGDSILNTEITLLSNGVGRGSIKAGNKVNLAVLSKNAKKGDQLSILVNYLFYSFQFLLFIYDRFFIHINALLVCLLLINWAYLLQLLATLYLLGSHI